MSNPILIVVFAVIAAVVLFMLYRVLGKPIGRQPEDEPVIAPPPAAPLPNSADAAAPGARQPPLLDPHTAAAVAGLKVRDPAFDPARFLEGARQAHETIVRAYAAGDRAALKPLLTDSVMASFEAGMAAREARGDVETVEYVHPPRADLEHATVIDDRAVAKVRFLAEIRSRLKSAGTEEEVVDERRTAENWTFQRTLAASDPNWVLARVEPATA